MDALGSGEYRVLGVERSVDRLDSQLFALRQRLTALEQGIWDAWSEVTAPAPAPTSSGTYPGCNPTYVWPTTLTLTDITFGGTVTLSPAGSNTWLGCHSVHTSPASTCSAVTTALWFELVVYPSTCQAKLTWWHDGSGIFSCPISGVTCSGSYNTSFTGAVPTSISGAGSGTTLSWDAGVVTQLSSSHLQASITLP
jgi:hypothetical protein